MIYTVTFNPALDYAVGVEHMRLGEVNRTCSEKILPGGKGINVSIVLGNLGHESVALGFVAGFTGRETSRSRATRSPRSTAWAPTSRRPTLPSSWPSLTASSRAMC